MHSMKLFSQELNYAPSGLSHHSQQVRWMRASLAALLLCLLPFDLLAQPALKRIQMATLTTPDLKQLEAHYGEWIGYQVRERGLISEALARSWDAPEIAGQPYVLMSSDAAPEVFIRAIQATSSTPDYRALTDHGWNAIEIIVDDPDGLRQKLDASPFRIIGEPAPLGAYPTIRAFQVVGPSGEVIYFTAETGDRSKSPLPLPNGDIGRIFIMVVAGGDIEALLDFYSSRFQLQRNPARQMRVGVVARAQQLPEDETIGLATARLAEHGNLIEFDGYNPARTGPRAKRKGDLPAGIVGTSFAVDSLDALDLEWITPPARYTGLAYPNEARAATVRGPAGELIELIERP
jgi:hypothetical protein